MTLYNRCVEVRWFAFWAVRRGRALAEIEVLSCPGEQFEFFLRFGFTVGLLGVRS